MKYQIYINYREWEIIAETFEFERYYNKEYEHRKNIAVARQAWEGNIPLYLHDVGTFDPEYLLETLENLVTPESIFCIFEKENLPFKEMIQEIWKRRDDIIKPTEGDDNPYEGEWMNWDGND
jgi:hypothetical protein